MTGLIDQATAKQQANRIELDHLRIEAAELREACARLEAKLAAAVKRLEEIREVAHKAAESVIGRRHRIDLIEELAEGAIAEANE